MLTKNRAYFVFSTLFFVLLLHSFALFAEEQEWLIEDNDIRISLGDIQNYIQSLEPNQKIEGDIKAASGFTHHLETYYVRERLVRQAEADRLDQSEDYQKALREFQKNYLARQSLSHQAKKALPDFTARAKELYIAEKKSRYTLPLQLRVGLIEVKKGEDAEQSRKHINWIVAQLKADKLSFDEAVEKYSDDTLKRMTKGDSFWFSKGQKPDVIFAAAEKLSAQNNYSPIIEHRDTWYVLKYRNRKEPYVQSFDEVKESIISYLKDEWTKEFQQEKLRELKARFTQHLQDIPEVAVKLEQ